VGAGQRREGRGKVWNLVEDRGEVGSNRFGRHELWKCWGDIFIFINKALAFL
jgi:hypothetical protein